MYSLRVLLITFRRKERKRKLHIWRWEGLGKDQMNFLVSSLFFRDPREK